LPDTIENIFDILGDEGTGTNEFAQSRVQTALLIFLAVLVIAAVVYSAIAALKYIQSQGDPGKIEEAGKAVKAIFIGLAVMLLSIVGIVLVFVFFGAEFFGAESYQTCLSAANSKGCIACKASTDNPAGPGGLPSDWDTIKFSPGLPATTDTPTYTAAFTDPTGPTGNKILCLACEWSYFNISRGTTVGLAAPAAGTPHSLFCTE
jgi:hypothetical protein